MSSYSFRTIAKVKGSSPVEQPALQTSNGLPAPFLAMRSGRAVSSQKLKVGRLPEKIGFIRCDNID